MGCTVCGSGGAMQQKSTLSSSSVVPVELRLAMESLHWQQSVWEWMKRSSGAAASSQARSSGRPRWGVLTMSAQPKQLVQSNWRWVASTISTTTVAV
eukprot:6473129-Amphidinium_carterae.1